LAWRRLGGRRGEGGKREKENEGRRRGKKKRKREPRSNKYIAKYTPSRQVNRGKEEKEGSRENVERKGELGTLWKARRCELFRHLDTV
jgi:hypothetical protein